MAAVTLPTKSPPRASSPREKLLVASALFAVYVIWGSTYYAMRVVLGVLPPFLMAGTRFLLAGGVLLLIQRLRGESLPTRKQWLSAGAVGVLLLFCGNGLVAIAQQTVDSGVAATVVATMPLWMAAIGSVWGDRPTAREVVGLLLGFAGIAILRYGGSLSFGDGHALLLLLAPIAWAFGSLLSRKIDMPKGLVAAAAQMLVGGGVMLAIAIARGERPTGEATAATVSAYVFLVLGGSLVAFSAYSYLLRTTRPSIASSYAYVNPLVALALGAVLGGESFTPAKLIACLLTIGGVLVVTLGPRRAQGAK
jgi:drug/metabolite transporter (DMT)-like permease